MKIAFKGLRGFGGNADFVEVRDLTVLTGKNSSGKSTFIKLLQLLSGSLISINSLHELLRLKIDSGNELIGGKEKLESLQAVTDVEWIFSVPFEFYIEQHEIHIKFSWLNDVLSVDSVKIHDDETLKTNKPFFTATFGTIKLNLRHLYKKYIKSALLYNAFELFRYLENKERDEDNLMYFEFIDLVKSTLELNEEEIKLLSKEYHISPYDFDDECVIGKRIYQEIENENQPFGRIYPPEGNHDVYLLFIPLANKLHISKNEIKTIIESNKITKEDFFDTSKKHDSKIDLENLFEKWHENFLENYAISSNSFELFHQKSPRTYWDNQTHQLTSSVDLSNIGKKVHIIDSTIETTQPIAEISSMIFEKYILRFINVLSKISIQSSVRSSPTRSFNIYNSSNTFSSFIKHWKLNDGIGTEKQSILIKYLKRFEIADDLNIKIDKNVGFIELLKKGNLFSLIDEGSGTSNLISCLLFLVINSSDDMVEYSESGPSLYDKKWSDWSKILVLEEPEANLHPNLQSQLADLLVDFAINYDNYIIVETHSEYFIRKLQYLIAKKQISPEQVCLNYFSMRDDGKNPFIKIKNIKIREDGTLSAEFGSGFLDEADNISIGLFNIQKSQRN